MCTVHVRVYYVLTGIYRFDSCIAEAVRERQLARLGCVYPWALPKLDNPDPQEGILCKDPTFYQGHLEKDIESEVSMFLSCIKVTMDLLK